MKKKSKIGKKLQLSRDTLRLLQSSEITDVAHGGTFVSRLACDDTHHPTVCPGPVCTVRQAAQRVREVEDGPAVVWPGHELAFQDLGALNVPVALAIAGGKALLVILYFMHVKDSTRVVWVYVAMGFYWFAILVGLTLADFLTRGWGPIGTG